MGGEDRMGKRTGAKKGAPYGNKNRLKHGRYSRTAQAAHKEAMARLRHLQLMEAWSKLLVRTEGSELARILGLRPQPS
jgi:hypothetical protein